MRSFRPPAVAVAMLFFATGAEMMPAGPSPESGLAGVWRFVAATPAPWAKPRKLTKADAPLLEYAIQFADNEVKGPESLACTSARYSSGVTYPAELFGGRLANDKDGAKARSIHLSQPGATTFRFICGKTVRDIYMDDNADFVMAEGDVIYTLRRPEGNPEQFAAGFSGPSFDCTKARTAGEHMLCSDANLAETDRKLNAAYARLKRTETPASFATVQAAQRDWLVYVLKTCGANVPLPDDQGEKNDIQECLSDNYGDRADRLHAIEVVKSGALTLEPRMRFFTRAKSKTEDSDIYPWMNGGTSADAFNAWVDKVLELSKRRMDNKALFAFTAEQVGDLKLSARRTYSVARLDSKIASFQTATFDYTGGAHEAIGEEEFNWDMRANRAVQTRDVFAKGKDWKKFVIDYCLKDLATQFKEQQSEAPTRDSVAAVVESGAFLFGPKNLTVHFTVYTIASFSGGEYDVEIPYSALKPYLKPDAPIL